MTRIARYVLVWLVAALTISVLAACADGGEDSEADVEVGDVGDVPASVESEAQVVGIELFDDRIQMPQTIDTNIRSFKLLNLGTEDHTLAIRGGDVDLRFNEDVETDNEKVYTIDAELPAGTYEFYCPLEGHAERGETIEVTVGN